MIKFLRTVTNNIHIYCWIAYQIWKDLVQLSIWPKTILIEFNSGVSHSIKDIDESTEKKYHVFKGNNWMNSQEKFTELSTFWNNWSMAYR